MNKDNDLMTRVARYLVDRRRSIMLLFAALAVLSLYTSTLVKTNESLEHFLPADTETRIGLDIMDNEFVTYDTAQVVVKTISLAEAQRLAAQIEAIDNVKEVVFDGEADHYQNVSALFDVTFSCANDAPESRAALAEIERELADYDLYINTEVGNPLKMIIDREMIIVDAIAFLIVIVVLLITSRTYGEVPVLLLTFGAAALLNMGTNFLMGEISFVTDSIALVLQLALAIDYAIILCHRFSEERAGKEPEAAAVAALSKAIPEISGSSLTTISGLLALTFMQYRLGADMGFVLIKAVLISLVSVFCLMPGLLVAFSGLIDRTAHRRFLPDVPFLGRFAYRTRKVIPILFALVLLGAFCCSNRVNYVYDQYTVESIRKNEIQIARQKIKDTFGTPTTFAIIVPAGSNDNERSIVAEVKELRHTLSVTGLSDIEAVDGYKLLDEVTPRQFSEIADVDIEVAELAYGSYALKHDEYGRAVTGIDNYRIALLDIFDYLLENKDDLTLNLDQETQDKLDDMKEKLDDGKLQLQSDKWSRIVVEADVSSEGPESYEYLSALRGVAARFYDQYYIVGTTTSCSDLKTSFEKDNTVITVLEIAFVTLILIFTFHSVGLPLLLIVVIQGSILTNFSSPYLLNEPLFFLTYLIISAIQMGANIDYAIVISDRYLEARRTLEPKEAIIEALNRAFPTVMTSGTMMASAGLIIAVAASNESISAIGVYLCKGTLISMLLVTCVLPQILLLGDRFIDRTSFTTHRGTLLTHSGAIQLNGRVKGYVNGYIDATVQGRFTGELNAHMDLGGAASPGLPPEAAAGDRPAEAPADGTSPEPAASEETEPTAPTAGEDGEKEAQANETENQ